METPEFFETSYYNAQHSPERRLPEPKTGDHFIIDDLLDLPNDETMVAADGCLDAAMVGTSTESSSATPVDTSCNSSFSTAEPHFLAADIVGTRSLADGHFSSELCVPYDDLAELEWLSNFVEESFSSEDLQKMQLIQGVKARTNEAFETHQYQFQPEASRPGPMLRSEMSVPAKARSKRSRAAPGNWTSRLLVVSPTPTATDVPAMSSSSESDVATTVGKKSSTKPAGQKKKEVPESSTGGEGRKCLHCATDKTPQWRTGPMGPKTLCNACGVRYKSGRLVPEYRPAASPTFVLTKHSNSHRKVLELRRQKEMMRTQQQQQQFLHHHHHHHQSMMFDVSNSDDYLIHQHIGPDFRQLI
ncbi:UNVERIFIED_CONTAM: GATA transcription factor 12 [Sesamum angustifolium]|uniref:GATA transcription factor n=1 Tax=Sesamum angustifolium TaxID=2727405 RepID=A0AAW2LIC4_9LAMI